MSFICVRKIRPKPPLRMLCRQLGFLIRVPRVVVVVAAALTIAEYSHIIVVVVAAAMTFAEHSHIMGVVVAAFIAELSHIGRIAELSHIVKRLM